VSALLNAASARLRPILIMALETGMRCGEILKLKWSDVDMKNGMIYVSGDGAVFPPYAGTQAASGRGSFGLLQFLLPKLPQMKKRLRDETP